jgi:nucleotide-binding universal stress UspA family protein
VQRIIAGFDDSGPAKAALAWAAGEARRHEARLVTWTVPGPRPQPSAFEVAALNALRGTVQEITGDDEADLRFAYGAPAAELIAACADADLLVVGARGHGTVGGVLLGSVSRACLHHAPCSVAVVRAPSSAHPHGRVVVGVDGSQHARRALVVAAEEARLRDAELVAVHAGREGERLLDAELAGTGVSARPVAVDGHPSDVLVVHSADADLLVVGSRGHNPLAGLLLGSTGDDCARRAQCPAMIVR